MRCPETQTLFDLPYFSKVFGSPSSENYTTSWNLIWICLLHERRVHFFDCRIIISRLPPTIHHFLHASCAQLMESTMSSSFLPLAASTLRYEQSWLNSENLAHQSSAFLIFINLLFPNLVSRLLPSENFGNESCAFFFYPGCGQVEFPLLISIIFITPTKLN